MCFKLSQSNWASLILINSLNMFLWDYFISKVNMVNFAILTNHTS